MGALYWPDEGLLVVADLHLEKGSATPSAACCCRPMTPRRRWRGWRKFCPYAPRAVMR
jgi:metallophosphoesterase superfamily enzyme